MEGSPSNKRPAPAVASLLTDDLVVEILSRLPYRSLCRFKCVSKSWLALCSDPDLRKKSPQTLSGFFYQGRHARHFINLSGRGRPMVNPSFSLPSCVRVEFVDSCNGLLLLCLSLDHYSPYEYAVCNPATEKWTVVPNTEAMQGRFSMCLGFDPAVSSHFGVFLLVQTMQDVDHQVTGVEIYSSETGGWTYRQSEWGYDTGVFDAAKSVFFDGIMHFASTGSSVVTVDMEGKTWRKIPAPHRTYSCFIGLSQGRLYSVHSDYYKHAHQLAIWVLEDYGSAQWVLKHTVNTSELFEQRHLKFSYVVIAVHPEWSLIFLTVGMQINLISYDMDSRTVHAICTLGDYCVHPYLLLGMVIRWTLKVKAASHLLFDITAFIRIACYKGMRSSSFSAQWLG